MWELPCVQRTGIWHCECLEFEVVKWDKNSVAVKLREDDWYGSERVIEHGTQFVLVDNTKVNCFDTGKVSVQGKDTDIKWKAKALFSQTDCQRQSPAPGVASAVPAAQSRVFIVYGHDQQACEQLELLLRRLQLRPIVLQNIPGSGNTLIEKLEKLTVADFACVLLTPDDEGRKRDDAADLRPRARQNVVLELGMVLARLGRQRVAILVKGDDIERPSDISGLIYIPFSDHVNDAKNKIAANLEEAGFAIQVTDLQGD